MQQRDETSPLFPEHADQLVVTKDVMSTLKKYYHNVRIKKGNRLYFEESREPTASTKYIPTGTQKFYIFSVLLFQTVCNLLALTLFYFSKSGNFKNAIFISLAIILPIILIALSIYLLCMLDHLRQATRWWLRRVLEISSVFLLFGFVIIIALFVYFDHFSDDSVNRIWCILYFTIGPIILMFNFVVYRSTFLKKIDEKGERTDIRYKRYLFEPHTCTNVIYSKYHVTVSSCDHIPTLVTLHVFDNDIDDYSVKNIQTTVEIVHVSGSIVLCKLKNEPRSMQEKIAIQLATLLQVPCNLGEKGSYSINSNNFST